MKILYTEITNCAMCPNYFVHKAKNSDPRRVYGACMLLKNTGIGIRGLLDKENTFRFRDKIHHRCQL